MGKIKVTTLHLDKMRVKSLRKKGYNLSQIVRNFLEELDIKTNKKVLIIEK